MKTTQEIIDEVNAAEICGLPYVEDEEIGELGRPIATGLDPDEHRWYVVSINVYRHGDDFIGLCGVSGLKSESMGYDDCGVVVEAFEMEEKQSVTYVPKK